MAETPGLHILGRENEGDRWLFQIRLVTVDEYPDDDVLVREFPGGGGVMMSGGTATTSMTAWAWYCQRCRRNSNPLLLKDVAILDYDAHLPCEPNDSWLNALWEQFQWETDG